MSIERYPHTCMVVHLVDSEAHLPDAQAAEAWIGQLDVGIRVHAIEEAQQPCWTAHCDEPACEQPEANENDDAIHILAATAEEAEAQLGDLQRVNGVLLCVGCRDES